MARGPAVFRDGRAQHPDFRRARGTRGAELPVREQGAEQVLGRALGQILVVELEEALAREIFDQRALRCVQLGRGERQHRIDPFAPQRLRRSIHRSVSLLVLRPPVGVSRLAASLRQRWLNGSAMYRETTGGPSPMWNANRRSRSATSPAVTRSKRRRCSTQDSSMKYSM